MLVVYNDLKNSLKSGGKGIVSIGNLAHQFEGFQTCVQGFAHFASTP